MRLEHQHELPPPGQTAPSGTFQTSRPSMSAQPVTLDYLKSMCPVVRETDKQNQIQRVFKKKKTNKPLFHLAELKYAGSKETLSPLLLSSTSVIL